MALTKAMLSALNKKKCEILSTTNQVINAHVEVMLPMHLSSGHVTLMLGKFSPFLPPPNFFQSDLGRRAYLR